MKNIHYKSGWIVWFGLVFGFLIGCCLWFLLVDFDSYILGHLFCNELFLDTFSV